MANAGVGGIVLAAGRSRRMGAPKPLLELDGRTFLKAAVAALREGGCGAVVVVVAGPEVEAEARQAGAAVAAGAPDGQQIDSLRAGLDALSADVAAALVLPVDHPRVAPATVRALLAAAAAEPGAIVRPVYRDRPGHPTLFPRGCWPALRERDLPRGAESVVESPGTRTVDVPVTDPGVVTDIDTPAAYRRHVEE